MDADKENVTPPPRRAAVVRIEAELSWEEEDQALRHCPVVRMGRVQPGTAHVQEEGRVWVIPKEHCIGCGICVAKVPAKLEMLEW